MSRHRSRGIGFGDRSRKIKEFIVLYQQSLRTLIASLPEKYSVATAPSIAAVGLSEIWPCKDGTVALIYQNSSTRVVIKSRLNTTVNEFLSDHDATAYYDSDGKLAPVSFDLQFEDVSGVVAHFAGLRVQRAGKEYRPRYQRGVVFGHRAQLPEPDEVALVDFRTVFVTRNVGGDESIELSPQKAMELTAKNALRLSDGLSALLEAADREEELQQYLNKHPELLYPDFIECFPKFALGDDFETDYVFLVQSHQGPEYVFVEIERPDKRIFTRQGHFTADFTQAKGQLLDWDGWITQNISYVQTKLPGLFKPKFHLVMGRSEGLVNDQRAMIRTEFESTSRVFSTYDDLVDRFQQIITRITQGN
jgi:hypothetical protein